MMDTLPIRKGERYDCCDNVACKNDFALKKNIKKMFTIVNQCLVHLLLELVAFEPTYSLIHYFSF